MPHNFELKTFLFRRMNRQNERMTFGMTLGNAEAENKARVFLFNRTPYYRGYPYTVVYASEIDVEGFENLPTSYRQQIRMWLRDFALEKGLLFDPPGPLTWREQGKKGPSKCSHCHKIVSFKKKSLGCEQCRYYACPDGYCLCGEGWLTNYLGQRFPPQPKLKCDWRLRRVAAEVGLRISPIGTVIA